MSPYANRDSVYITTLCGSTRFKKEFLKAAADEALKGYLVFTVNWFSHADGSLGEESENKFRELHFQKMVISDDIFVVNVGGYIGEQTRKEIEFCLEHGIPVRYLESIQ